MHSCNVTSRDVLWGRSCRTPRGNISTKTPNSIVYSNKSVLHTPLLSQHHQHPLYHWSRLGVPWVRAHYEFLHGLRWLLFLRTVVPLPQDWDSRSQLDLGWTPDPNRPMTWVFGIKTETQSSQPNMNSSKGVDEPQKPLGDLAPPARCEAGSKHLSTGSRRQR